PSRGLACNGLASAPVRGAVSSVSPSAGARTDRFPVFVADRPRGGCFGQSRDARSGPPEGLGEWPLWRPDDSGRAAATLGRPASCPHGRGPGGPARARSAGSSPSLGNRSAADAGVAGAADSPWESGTSLDSPPSFAVSAPSPRLVVEEPSRP